MGSPVSRFACAIIIIFVCCDCRAAQSRHKVTLEDLLSIKSVDDQMEISPDSKTIAYVVDDALWLVSTEPASVPNTIGKGRLPRWSPDGSRIAFYSTEAGTFQLWVVDVKSGRKTQVTNIEGGIAPEGRTVGYWISDPLRYCWSPDGTRLVFTSQKEVNKQEASQQLATDKAVGSEPLVLTASTPPDWTLSGVFRFEPGPLRYVNGQRTADAESTTTHSISPVTANHLFIVDIATKQVQQLSKDDDGYYNPDWSPDGRTIVCGSSEGRPLGRVYGSGFSNIYLIDVATGQKTALTSGPGDKYLPYWSPDGKWVAYIGTLRLGMRSAFLIHATGGTSVNLTAKLDRLVRFYYWSEDSRSLVVSCVDGVSWPIVRVDIRAGDFHTMTPAEASYFPFAISRSGMLVWVLSDGSTSGVIQVKSPSLDRPYVVADLNPQVREWAVGAQEIVRWKNSRGEQIEGILIKPASYKEGRRYPLIVDPYSGWWNAFMYYPMFGNQGFATRGYAVFFPNHRPPHKWQDLMTNEAYSRVARGRHGWDIALDDILTGVDTLIKRGIVDPSRMGLYGFSNGAGAANYLVTRTARFKCAVSAAGIYSDWARWFLLNTDEALVPDLVGGPTPWDDPEAYVELSPVYHLDKVSTPMLLAVGDKDLKDHIFDSVEMYNGLRWLKRDVTLLRYPEQGHGFTGEALKDYWSRANAFLDKHLKPKEPAEIN